MSIMKIKKKVVRDSPFFTSFEKWDYRVIKTVVGISVSSPLSVIRTMSPLLRLFGFLRSLEQLPLCVNNPWTSLFLYVCLKSED